MEIPKAKPWLVPREGHCLISFRAARFPAEMIHVESAEGLAAMVENIQHVSVNHEEYVSRIALAPLPL